MSTHLVEIKLLKTNLKFYNGQSRVKISFQNLLLVNLFLSCPGSPRQILVHHSLQLQPPYLNVVQREANFPDFRIPLEADPAAPRETNLSVGLADR